MINEKIKIGTFFSGIGAPEMAFKKLKKDGYINDYEIKFFSEIDKDSIKSYCAIHSVDSKLNLGDITKIDGKILPYCDIWIGGFPCQDISCAGKMKGFNKDSFTRSSLGWQMIRILKEVENKPKYIIFENVANITSKPFKDTLSLFKKDLIDVGYTIYEKVLNAIDFEIPQTRKRYFLVAILDSKKYFEFPIGIKTNKKLKDFLDKTVDEKYYYTTNNYIKSDDVDLILTNKEKPNIKYIINLEKLLNGGVCGKDLHCKFQQSSRLFSENGYAPTITASNTTDNAKIVVESELI